MKFLSPFFLGMTILLSGCGGSSSGTKTGSETEPGTGSETEPGTGSETEPGTGSETEPGTGSENPQEFITSIDVKPIKSLPLTSRSLLAGDNQSIATDFQDNLYVTRRDEYYLTPINYIMTTTLYSLQKKNLTWLQAELPIPEGAHVGTYQAIEDYEKAGWGIQHVYIPNQPSSKVYLTQLNEICSANISILQFECEKNHEKLQYDFESGIKALKIKTNNIHNFNHSLNPYTYAISPTNSSVWLKESNYGDISNSADSGKTWNLVRKYGGSTEYPDFGQRVRTIQYVFSNTKQVYASSSEGILKSEDGGKNWKIIYNDFIEKLAVSGNGQFIIAMKYYDSRSFLYSADFGKTWETYKGIKSYAVTASQLEDGVFYISDKNDIYKITLNLLAK